MSTVQPIYRLNEVKLTVKRSKRIPATAVSCKSPADVARIAMMIADKSTIAHHETMLLIAMSQANTPLAFYVVSEGGINCTVGDVRMIFQALLLTNAVAFVLVHNHPSGNLEPSREDIGLTRELKRAGDLMSINLLDHIILTPDKAYTSLAERGLI